MSTYLPVYKKGRESGVIVKFVGLKEGYVIDPGTTDQEIGSFHTDWRGYYEDCWEPYEYADSATPTKTPDQLELFESTIIKITTLKDSIITKVPNGYVMTSQSGHQLFIKDLSKESL